MVFLSASLLTRSRGPDEFWRKRRIFKLAAHFFGRRRNCYSITIRAVQKCLVDSTKGRKVKKEDMKELWDTRVGAAAEQHGLNADLLRIGLHRCDVLLNRKSLADLAIWEPRTFKSLVDVAAAKLKVDGHRLSGGITMPEHVVPEGLVKS